MKRDGFLQETGTPHGHNASEHLARVEPMISPLQLQALLPLSARAADTVSASRKVLRAILERRDPRLLVVVGPCSIHDPHAALDYAQQLQVLASELAETLFVVMRVYPEKPRSRLGWKGLINDPLLDDSCRIDQGMLLARSLLLQVNELGLPVAVEALDPFTPHYLHDLVSWAAIGARTTESQIHRELASSLPLPVGFKNGTDGNVEVAINAILAARAGHAFLGINGDGRAAILRTDGNLHGHLILRGGASGPNHDRASVQHAASRLQAAGLAANIVVDCSHANCGKNHLLQERVLQDLVQQIAAGNRDLVGVMLESFLQDGNQPLALSASSLRYGCSITDPCLSWSATQAVLREAHAALLPFLESRKAACHA